MPEHIAEPPSRLPKATRVSANDYGQACCCRGAGIARCVGVGHERRVTPMLHHDRAYVDGVQAGRLVARGRLPADAGELERMVLAASAGDMAGWSRLVQRFAARLRAVGHAHRLCAHDAEDVVQTTWLRLLEHIDGVREPRAVGAWLETTAQRESLRILRTSRRPTDSEQRAPESVVAAVAEQRLVASQTRAALAEAITSLPHAHRRLLAMLFADPAPSYQAISRTLGMPIGSIGPTRARILARLRQDPGLASAIGNDPE